MSKIVKMKTYSSDSQEQDCGMVAKLPVNALPDRFKRLQGQISCGHDLDSDGKFPPKLLFDKSKSESLGS